MADANYRMPGPVTSSSSSAAPNSSSHQSNGNNPSSSNRPRANIDNTAPSPLRTPKDVWQNRQARMVEKEQQQQQQADLERLQAAERRRAEEEARMVEEAQRRYGDRDYYSQQQPVNPPSSSARQDRQPADRSRARAQSNAQPPTQYHHQQPPPVSQPPPQQQQKTYQTAPSQQQQQQQQQQQHQLRKPTGAPAETQNHPHHHPHHNPRPDQGTANAAAAAATSGHRPSRSDAAPPPAPADASFKPRSSFPHAFERWETLSAHWEGLINFWIRKLEANKEEVDRDPLSQQLGRQVTDLSAAGANLFHAVVELQRLRASSERKFTRWFFETRTELERCQEELAKKDLELRQVSARADTAHRQNDIETQLRVQNAELKKELAISKDEARRAWEELGRREQEERDRTLSLQSGKPTIVGGVQVVPMTQGIPSRYGSNATSSREPRYQEYDDRQMSQQQQHQHQQQQQNPYQPEYTQAPPVQAVPAAMHGAQLHQVPSYGSAGSDEPQSEGEYIIDSSGNFVRDPHGRRIPYKDPPSPLSSSEPHVAEDSLEARPGYSYPTSPGGDSQSGGAIPPGAPWPPTSDEYEPPSQLHHPSHHQQQQQHQPQQHLQMPPQHHQQSQQHQQQHQQQQQLQPPPQQQQSAPPLSGYGNSQDPQGGWDAVPRHHHPTRLSDVMEEDERSRTSASQLSRA